MKPKNWAFYVALILILIGMKVDGRATSSAATASASAASVKKTTRVKVYLVALGDNGKIGRRIGCEDSLVAVTRTVAPTSAPLRAAIDELLSMPEEQTEGGRQLGNYWKGSDLKVKSISLKRGTATIWITGTLTVAGICDQPRIVEQMRATARQFSTVKRVRVFVNGISLEQAIR